MRGAARNGKEVAHMPVRSLDGAGRRPRPAADRRCAAPRVRP
jgi:hypothetical protein